MNTIKGPAIFLAQFAGDASPFNSLDAIAGWAAGLGFRGVQIPTWDARLFILARRSRVCGFKVTLLRLANRSKAYASGKRKKTTNGKQNRYQLRYHRLDPYSDDVGGTADHA